jgi:hypothetical protein
MYMQLRVSLHVVGIYIYQCLCTEVYVNFTVTKSLTGTSMSACHAWASTVLPEPVCECVCVFVYGLRGQCIREFLHLGRAYYKKHRAFHFSIISY